MRRAMVAAIAVVLLAAVQPAVVGAQVPADALVAGDIPEGEGVTAVTISYPAPASDVDAYLAILGCEAVSLAVTEDGEWSVYVPGAPAHVNAGFPDLEMGAPVLVRCGEPDDDEVNTVVYACADGKSFVAHVEQVPGTRTIVEVGGRTVELRQVLSGSGIRYSSPDSQLLYISQGDTARIEEGGEVTYEDCVELEATSIGGTIDYTERIAVPSDATITVTLVDVSLQDAPATIVASESFAAGDALAPFSFELAYDAGDIEQGRTYNVQAEIRWGDELLYTTDEAYPVLTDAAETDEVALDLALVEPAVTPGDAAPLAANAWVWTRTTEDGEILEPNTEGDSRLTFNADGSMGTTTDCNLYFGLYTVRGDRMAIDVEGGTLMFCPDETTTESEYIGALGRVTGYALTGAVLTLELPGGGTMRFVASPD